jgi:hypothetical protein
MVLVVATYGGPELWGLAARPHLILPARVDPRGLTGPTEAMTRTASWRRSSPGRYVPASVALTTEQRIVEAACLLPEYGGVTGWADLHWRGGTRWFDGARAEGAPRPVWLAVGGDDVRPQPGINIIAERLDPRDLAVVDGLSVTTAVRSVCFEMRYALSERDAARTLSMAAYYDLVSIDELAEYASRHSGWTGIPRCRAAIPFAEENCWSPTEFEMVWVWRVEAELPRPMCNHPLFDLHGNHIGTPDLLDVEAGVVGQYEGGFHLAGAQRSVDVRAEERYRDLGLECFTMVAADRGNTLRMVARMHAARTRARWEPETRRQWTAEYPSWWVPTHTVELRRALDTEQQRRLLRYRAA